ncbi:MAG: class I SAM-dependent methyltransferase [Spirochaetales bacterium]|nr:class I SAM-dependent methyltransferase [Spirochaetales bacterium]
MFPEHPDLERVPCLLCGEGDSRLYADFDPYQVRLCLHCDFLYLSPRLKEEQMLKAYASDYFEGGGHGYDDYSEQALAQIATHRYFLKQLKRHYSLQGRLLEPGCGYGYFLTAARSYFSYQEGLDYSATALSVAAESADKVVLGGLGEASGEKFNWIFAHQVIEHIYNPNSFLQSVHSLLLPGGHVVLTTPRARGFWHTLMGRHWSSYKVPEHVAFFTPHHLKNLLERAGFFAVRLLPFWHAFPVALVLKKAGISISGWKQQSIWIPGTTFAAVGRR